MYGPPERHVRRRSRHPLSAHQQFLDISGAPKHAYWLETDADGTRWLACARRSVPDGRRRATFLLLPVLSLAIEVEALRVARARQCAGVRVLDRSTGDLYEASLDTLEALGTDLRHPGFAPQVRLALTFWTRILGAEDAPPDKLSHMVDTVCARVAPRVGPGPLCSHLFEAAAPAAHEQAAVVAALGLGDE